MHCSAQRQRPGFVTMDALFSQFGPALGAFAPCALLGWWIIRSQSETIKAKDQRIEALTTALLELARSGERTAAIVMGNRPPTGG